MSAGSTTRVIDGFASASLARVVNICKQPRRERPPNAYRAMLSIVSSVWPRSWRREARVQQQLVAAFPNHQLQAFDVLRLHVTRRMDIDVCIFVFVLRKRDVHLRLRRQVCHPRGPRGQATLSQLPLVSGRVFAGHRTPHAGAGSHTHGRVGPPVRLALG